MSKQPDSPQWREILCPVDFSDRSRKALETAISLAQRDSARLSLVHVLQPVPSPVVTSAPTTMPTVTSVTDAKKLGEQMRKDHEERLVSLIEKAVPSGLQCRHKVLWGRPADELADYAETNNVDLIVIATMGHGRWQRFLFGSVAERLIRLSRCAVLILPIE